VRVACETYVLLARFRDDTAKSQRGEPTGSPLWLFQSEIKASVSKKQSDGDGGASRHYDGDDADRGTMQGLTFGIERPAQQVANWIASRWKAGHRKAKLALWPRKRVSRLASQQFSQEQGIPRGDIESQVMKKVSGERI